MPDPSEQTAAIEQAIDKELQKTGRVFNLGRKVATEYHYDEDGMERVLEDVCDDLQPTYKYAYMPGDGRKEVQADSTLSQVITHVDRKTNPA